MRFFFIFNTMNIEDLYSLYTKNYLVDTETRTIRPNSIFFALKGDNFNGNTFAKKAIELGASYCVIDEADYEIKGATILVSNVLETLQSLATYHRQKLGIPIIGITGSNGKTTTKELIHAVLKKQLKACLLYTSDAADEEDSVDLGGSRIIKKKKKQKKKNKTTIKHKHHTH